MIDTGWGYYMNWNNLILIIVVTAVTLGVLSKIIFDSRKNE